MSLQDRLNKLKQSIARKPQKRTAQYIIQVGFDFGTSYSKCVYRELRRNRAWVFTFKDSQGSQGKDQFLLSSSIVYRDGCFMPNAANVQYPEEGGLWHIKMALADIAAKRYNSPVLTPFAKASGLRPGKDGFADFVKCAALFFLTRALTLVRKCILERFPDYGAHPQDDMYVTMAIPVSNITDKATEALFLQLLRKAWDIACSSDAPALDKITLTDMETLLNRKLLTRRFCAVYPEVSANLQAFINSPASPGRSSNIYLFTDTGAGTVDQCCFTFYNKQGQGDSLNYLAARVFQLGSGVIEQICARKFGGTVEQWRKQKESGRDSPLIDRALTLVEDKLYTSVSTQTLPQLQDHLYIGHGVFPPDTIRQYVFLIFTGGGDKNCPYHTAVIQGLKKKYGYPRRLADSTSRKERWENRVITMPTPKDLELPAGCEHWMKRLFVAYGISFNISELPTARLPHETALPQKSTRKHKQTSGRLCPYCRGQNPNCLHCDGYGTV